MEKRITPILLGLSNKVHTHKHMYSQTFTLTQTGAVFKEPGGYNCKTAMWNIYNLWCIWYGDMYKLQRNFNKAQAIKVKKKKKNFVMGCFHFLRNYFCRKKKLQCRVWTYNFFSLRKEKSNFIFSFLFFFFISMPYWSWCRGLTEAI